MGCAGAKFSETNGNGELSVETENKPRTQGIIYIEITQTD